jgi:hypothetical protein
MITFKQYLTEEAISLKRVNSLEDLIDPKTGEYYTEVVNVTGTVNISQLGLETLPVKFGTVGSNFDCSENELTTLEGAPSSVDDDFDCTYNKLTSLQGIHKIIKIINGEFFCNDNPITSGGIGLILIEGLTKIYVDRRHAFDIINKYLGRGKKGLLLCQDELIEAGYEEYARL